MKTIDWVEYERKGSYQKPNLVAYTLLEAMSATIGKEDIKEYFSPFKPEALQVELKVNGKEVDFVHAMSLIQQAIDNLEGEIRQGIMRDAAEMLIGELQNKVNEICK